jgi:putative endonuclease
VSGYFCYILECGDGTFYTGWTADPRRRLKEHAAGRGARYTRARRPVCLVYLEIHPDRTAAMRRERSLKALSRARKLDLIRANGDLEAIAPDE